jgi:bla regulator protein BlaR1
MTPEQWSSMWRAIPPGLGNHLWQSTLFAIAAALLALILRKNQARVRYWVWLAASVKFLIPFSLLVEVGRHLAWYRASAGAQTGLYFVMQEMNQPFREGAMPPVARSMSSIHSASSIHLFPILALAAWLCGCAAVLLVWCVGWRRVAVALREAVPLREGREIEALRRLERTGGIRKRIEMFLSRASLEPGIFGIVRPVLIWPEGISEHLAQPHLDAILAHELWHIRRRDNLAAAIHMVVEALFWFHPLVWWLGTRLVEERERACDEEVVELGSDRQVYAESILKVCEFCVGSPLACVSGVTGSDLKRRMVDIMTERFVRKLDFGRKILLTAVAFLALAAPIEVSIKPSEISTPTYAGSERHMVRMMFSPVGFKTANTALQAVLQEAYGVQANQIVDAPEWLKTTAYDIDLKATTPEPSAATVEQRMDRNRLMLQALLADRFKLKVHHETKDLPTYSLVVAESGTKLQPATPRDTNNDGIKGPDGRIEGTRRMMMQMGGTQATGLAAQATPIADLAWLLSQQLGTPVVDKTGLTGSYAFNLQWSTGASQPAKDGDTAPDAIPASSVSSLMDAIHEQLGLKLEPQQAPMDVLVIDHIERPQETSATTF